MSNVGISLPTDYLLLTQNRDFNWKFTNLDVNGNPVNYPSGSELFFEIETGGQQDCIQTISQSGCTGGTYTLSFGGQTTSALAYNTITVSPYGATTDILHALEGLSSIGTGNIIVNPANLYSVWEIDIALNSGTDAVQQITFNGTPTAGNWRIAFGNQTTGLLAYNISASALQTALQGLSNIGSGNCSVISNANGFLVTFTGTLANTNVSQLIPHTYGVDLAVAPWVYALVGATVSVHSLTTGTPVLNDQLVNTINNGVNSFFNTFDGLLGVQIQYVINSSTNMTLKVTGNQPRTEASLATWGITVVNTDVMNALQELTALVGVINTLTVAFYWDRVFTVEFTGALGLEPQAAITINTSSLTSSTSDSAMTATITQPGVAQYTVWQATIATNTATFAVPASSVALIPNRVPWQLVYLPSGESITANDTLGGTPIALGWTRVQPPGQGCPPVTQPVSHFPTTTSILDSSW